MGNDIPIRVQNNYWKWRDWIVQELYYLCCKYQVDIDAIKLEKWDLWWLSIKTDSNNTSFLVDLHRLMNLSYEICYYCGNEWKMRIDDCEWFITICKRCRFKLRIDGWFSIMRLHIKKLIMMFSKK